ncbi:type II toxin-antitoxin system MqsA family antitoxin [Celerinatantimonas sp. MCCC 1A17872]|uniref:type II toxin-antitoxin system MqsA family antitoxin n=1 Tax=Celerinatantimonas sp. MCCC 1A17872 TaxID=3177514 RepID=UPI0038C78BE0
MASKLCPICGSGHLHAQHEEIEVEHMGHTGFISNQYSVCDSCGSEQAGAVDARFNKRAMIAFKKQAQGLLTGSEVREMRKIWGLSQEDAAKVFGGGPVAFSKYESDDVMQSEAMDRLLRLAKDVPSALDRLMLNAGIEHKVSLGWTTVDVVNFHKKVATRKTQVIRKQSFKAEVLYG